MDAFFSAILGEVASRFLSFLIDRCSSNLQSSKDEKIQRLERMLLRLAVAVEDAEGRHITNHAMLRQLNMLRQDMHRGYYLLDTFRLQQTQADDNKVSYNTLALSKFNHAKRAQVSTRSKQHGDMGELEQVLENLEIAIADMVEYVVLLKNYPSIYRQPYNTYMFMDKCIFGRQMDMEYVINFLFHSEPPITDNLGILPIIGPDKVGKSTLVEHVCYNERVRNHFSCIIFLTDNDFREEKSLLTLSNSRFIRYKHNSSSSASNGEERLLVIVELTEDIADEEWGRMYSSSRSCISAGSKIIITSRSEKIAKLGTIQPLCLKLLSREAYWYYFKVLTFGSSDPKELPEVASMSMAMFNGYFDYGFYKEFTGPFIDLRNLANLIQTNVYEGNWHNFSKRYRANETLNHFLLNTCTLGNSGAKSKFVFLPEIDSVDHYCEVYDHCQVQLANQEDQEAPRIDMQDVLVGRVAPHGRFDVVMWRSHLPPYYSYIYSCEVHEYRSEDTCRMGPGQKRKRKI